MDNGTRFEGDERRVFLAANARKREQRAARIWGGIHFRNSLEVSEDMGRKIAEYLVDNALKPAP